METAQPPNPAEPLPGGSDAATANPAAVPTTATANPAAVPATATAERTKAARSGRSPKDMAVSLLVLLVPIALLLAFYQVVLDGDEPAVIDPAPAIAEARAAHAFPVGELAELADDWRPISASFRRSRDGAYLRIGYVTPAGDGVQLVQSDVPAERLIPAELTRAVQARGTVRLAGRSWQRYTARAGENALVLLEPDRTVIVVGSAAESELRDLAAKLLDAPNRAR